VATRTVLRKNASRTGKKSTATRNKILKNKQLDVWTAVYRSVNQTLAVPLVTSSLNGTTLCFRYLEDFPGLQSGLGRVSVGPRSDTRDVNFGSFIPWYFISYFVSFDVYRMSGRKHLKGFFKQTTSQNSLGECVLPHAR
jgi:hypothetical protein